MRIPAILLLIGSLFAIGCESTPTSSSVFPHANSMPTVNDMLPPADDKPGEAGQAYLRQGDSPINGHVVYDYNTILRGMKKPDGSGWLIKPEFTQLVGYGKLLYGRRYGEENCVRFDLSTGIPREEPCAFTSIAIRDLNNDGKLDEHDEWLGLNKNTHVVAWLDAQGHVGKTAQAIDVLGPGIEHLPGGRALVFHGDGFDRVYDYLGLPLGPEVPPLWSKMRSTFYLRDMPTFESKVFGVCIDKERSRYWPLLEDGRMFPKPDDCLGLQPLTDTDNLHVERWNGWLVWWKTPAGERCAWIGMNEATQSYEKIMATRSQAKWSEYATKFSYDRGTFIDYRCEPERGYEALITGTTTASRPLTTMADARKWADDEIARRAEESKQINEAFAREREREQRREYDERAARGVELRARQAQEQKADDDARATFDAALARNDKAATRIALLRLNQDPQRWTEYVKRFGLDPAGDNTSNSVGYARAMLGGTDKDVLAAALKATEPAATYQAPQSDWDYFFNGPRGGYTPSAHEGYQVDSRLVGQGFINHQESIRQQNQAAWLRGAQNWGAR